MQNHSPQRTRIRVDTLARANDIDDQRMPADAVAEKGMPDRVAERLEDSVVGAAEAPHQLKE